MRSDDVHRVHELHDGRQASATSAAIRGSDTVNDRVSPYMHKQCQMIENRAYDLASFP